MIRHGGTIAPGFTVSFSFNPATGEIRCEHDGRLGRASYTKSLRRYRAIRYEFLQRVAALVGHSITVVELDEKNEPDRLMFVESPTTGNA
jgi:hypothetical protein